MTSVSLFVTSAPTSFCLINIQQNFVQNTSEVLELKRVAAIEKSQLPLSSLNHRSYILVKPITTSNRHILRQPVLGPRIRYLRENPRKTA
jgi:hypothetical protein